MAHTKENKTGVLLNNPTFIKTTIDKFYKINNIAEFVSILNFIDEYTNNSEEQIYPVTIKHLYFLSKSKNKRYKKFNILKKSGKLREINSPDKIIKRVQSLINILLQIIFEPYSHYCSNGFLKGKDIVRNALPHINKNYVLNVDIKDFFPSINFRRIKVVLELSPFNLIGNREKIGFLISNICSYNGNLPQGAPTSPILSNIVTQQLDRKVSKFCVEKKIKYSRYADDLSFSSNRNIFDEEFINSISLIITGENFEVNNEKTRVRNNMQCQEVTGLVVNNKVNVKRKYLQKVRAMLNNWEKGGLRFAQEKFKTYQPLNKVNYDFQSVLLGHLSFLKLIKGEDNQSIKRLRKKYVFLNNLIDYSYIENDATRKKLSEDNLKMENIFFEGNNNDDNFISFCTSAFHQIENLLNYYYWKKFPFFDDLINELLSKNERFKKQFKTLEKAKERFSKIRDLDINVLVFLYEKEFFFDRKVFYNRHITMLREIRNDASHRCSISDLNIEDLRKDYSLIEEERIDKLSRGKNFILSTKQKKIELNIMTINFLEEKKYRKVRIDLQKISSNIQKYFASQPSQEI